MTVKNSTSDNYIKITGSAPKLGEWTAKILRENSEFIESAVNNYNDKKGYWTNRVEAERKITKKNSYKYP